LKPLQGHHAVVTGGARGIGEAIAQALGNAGARLTLVGRDQERLAAVAARMQAEALVLDVTDESAVTAAFASLGQVDVLINSAGAALSASTAATTRVQWDTMLAVNLTGLFHTCRAVAAGMAERGRGRIVNVVSTAGLVAYRDVAAYVAAKHGAIGLTRALALELSASGVTVNAVCPGYTDTGMFRDAIAKVMAKTGRTAEDARRMLVKGNPQGRAIQPAEVAEAVLWLCLPAASSVTGQSIVIAGGEVMH
jgi:3-hydroxybutyrate dehydrogenase